MKPFICVIVLIVLSLTSFSQACTDQVLLKKNTVVQYTLFNSRSVSTGNVEFAVQSINTKSGTIESTVKTRFLNRQNAPVHTMTNPVKCVNEALLIDFRMVMPREQLEQINKAGIAHDPVFVEYPFQLNQGQSLKDAKLSVSSNENGIQQSATLQISDRKVIDKQRVSTKAGSWDSYQITSTISIQMQTGPISIPLQIKITEWFVPHIGVVKSLFDNGSRQELVSLR